MKQTYCDKCREFIYRCRDSQCRYEPVEIKVLTSKADKRYYKLHNGNILDLDTKTILDRTGLTALLDD